jgi:hypothetical protein
MFGAFPGAATFNPWGTAAAANQLQHYQPKEARMQFPPTDPDDPGTLPDDTQPGPVPPFGPNPVPPNPENDPIPEPDDPGENPDLPPAREPFPDDGEVPDV